MTRRRIGFLVTLALGLLVAPLVADAQQSTNVHRIGWLSADFPPPSSASHAREEAFRQGLRELGYVEGQNLVIESRYAEGRAEWLPDLAAELVRLPVDLILVGASASALMAQQATTTIPIVFFSTSDPVGRGLVASLARPGGNITGVSFDVSPEIEGKRLQLLTEAVPTVSRVAILVGMPRSPTYDGYEQAWESAARRLGLTLRYFYVIRPSMSYGLRNSRRGSSPRSRLTHTGSMRSSRWVPWRSGGDDRLQTLRSRTGSRR